MLMVFYTWIFTFVPANPATYSAEIKHTIIQNGCHTRKEFVLFIFLRLPQCKFVLVAQYVITMRALN